MPDVFLSYSREDQSLARLFAQGLEQAGFSVWWDQALKAGEAFDQVTERALMDARAVVVLWSRHSVDSRWVRAEASEALASQRLVPVMVESCKRPIMFELTHTAELTAWNGDASDPRWGSFVDGLRSSVGGDAVHAAAAHGAAGAKRPWPAWMAAGVLLFLLLAGGLWWLLRGETRKVALAAARPAVAVLPFDDLSADKDRGYLADGLAEEILNSLASVPGLKVFARNSSFEFRTRGESLKEFGKTLGATHLLEGSLRQSGDRLRITAQLIDARTEAHLWSRSYDRPLQDVFEVQQEIATLVAQTLEVSLGVGRSAEVPGSTRNVDAWDAFLAGNRSMSVLDASQETRQRAIDQFNHAVTIDPSFARAWAQLAAAYSYASVSMPDPPGRSWQALISEADAQASRLAPDAYYVRLGDMRRALQQGNWNEVDRLYAETSRLAVEQGMPNTVDRDRARFLWLVGRFKEAITFAETEKVRNPLDTEIAYNLGSLHGADGNLVAAVSEIDRGLQLGGSNQVILVRNALALALARHDRAEIIRRLDSLEALVERDSVNAQMRPLLDNGEKALALLRQIAASSRAPSIKLNVAQWAVYFGDPEFALSLVGSEVKRGGTIQVLWLWGAIFADMRRLPEFKQLVTDIGLVDYWRENGWGQPCQPIAGDHDFACH